MKLIKGNRCLKASYTIEACLVFPLVLYSVIFIVYAAFYMHNVAVLKETAYETAIYGTTLDKRQTEQMKQELHIKYNQAIGGRTIAMERPKAGIEVKNDQVIVRIAGKMKDAPISVLPNLGGSIVVEESVGFMNPLSKLRIYKMFKNIKR